MSGKVWTKTQPGDGDGQASAPKRSASEREVSQVTLSTIGDISVAAAETLGRVWRAPQKVRSIPILGFFILVYLVSCWLTVLAFKAAPWFRAFCVPLFPVLIATLAFWWSQRWRVRAQEWRFKLKVWQEALQSLGHEAANAANAIRANLIAVRLANPQASKSEHLNEIESGTKRMETAVQASQGPVGWKGSRRK
jgi:hypothetical protein